MSDFDESFDDSFDSGSDSDRADGGGETIIISDPRAITTRGQPVLEVPVAMRDFLILQGGSGGSDHDDFRFVASGVGVNGLMWLDGVI